MVRARVEPLDNRRCLASEWREAETMQRSQHPRTEGQLRKGCKWAGVETGLEGWAGAAEPGQEFQT